jgi:hypothetical protein
MKSYQVLKLIFQGQAKRLAAAFGIKETSAAKFLRDPNNSGAPNPLDRLCKVIDEAVLANRKESGLLVEFLRKYHLKLIRDDARLANWTPQGSASEILDTATKAVQALGLKGQSKVAQMRALVAARTAIDEAIMKIEEETKEDKG